MKHNAIGFCYWKTISISKEILHNSKQKSTVLQYHDLNKEVHLHDSASSRSEAGEHAGLTWSTKYSKTLSKCHTEVSHGRYDSVDAYLYTERLNMRCVWMISSMRE